MSARSLLALFDSVYVLALTAWVGSILFFSFVVAPVIFTVLGAESGAKFVRALFPRYYLWGAICGAVALPAFVAGPLCYPEFRGPRVGLQALAILCGTLIMLYAGNSLVPAINRARDAGPVGHQQFLRLHRLSVRLNAVALVIGLGLLIGFATRPAPSTEGIVELTPSEQARYDAAVNRTIEEVEAKYGLRSPRVPDPGQGSPAGPALDQATIQEIDSLYAKKRLRDQARAALRPAGAAPADRARPAAPPSGPSPSRREPPPTGSGQPPAH